jgi:hypothetical protein
MVTQSAISHVRVFLGVKVFRSLDRRVRPAAFSGLAPKWRRPTLKLSKQA